MDDRDEETLLLESRLCVPGWGAAAVGMARIEKGGSDRRYYRLTAGGRHEGPGSAVLMTYTGLRPDNASFFPATEVLGLAGVRALRIYHHDAARKLAWLEDLGRRDLWECRSGDTERLSLYRSALRQAMRLHRMRWEDVPPELRAGLQPPFDESLYLWEQNYFFDQFALRFSMVDADRLAAIRAGEEFAALARTLAALPRSLVHRDFQSQNVIIRNGEAWLIDYQGLRPGRPEYDLASLLYDPYVEFREGEREELAEYYFGLRSGDGSDCSEEVLQMCACQRLMQALGAYGKLGAGDGKTAFLRHIAPAVDNLRGILRRSGLLPALEEVLTVRAGALEAAGLTNPA